MNYYWNDKKSINVLEKYTTIWRGEINKNNQNELWIKNEKDDIQKLDDLIIELLDRNFYINLDENNIYLSLCQDSPLLYNEFEKNILKFLRNLEKNFNICIEGGEFNCWECRPYADIYKYTIFKKDNKFKLKKKKINLLKIS